jgi:hypothetical protein
MHGAYNVRHAFLIMDSYDANLTINNTYANMNIIK